MSFNTRRIIVSVSLVALCSVAPGCAKRTQTQESPAAASEVSSASSSSSEISPERQAQLDALAAQVNQESWTLKTPPTGPDAVELLVQLAKSQRGESVTAAALSGLGQVLKREADAPPEVMDVLLENFAAPSPRLASRALGVADRWLRGPRPDERLVDGVLKISQRSDFADGKARYALLEAVRQSNPSLLTGKFRQVLLSSLNANEPDVLISAIQILDDDQAPVRRSSQISGALTPLLKRYEPALRGVVLRAIARTAPPRDPVVEDALIASLTDKSAYVRSQACMGLGVVGTDKSVPALIPLLADLEDNRQQYYASTFEHPTVLKALNSSYWPHVADAAQYALLRLAPTAPRVDPPKPKDVEGSLKSNAKALRAWYAKNKDAYKAAAGGASASTTTQNASAKSSGEHSTQPVKAPLPANGN